MDSLAHALRPSCQEHAIIRVLHRVALATLVTKTQILRTLPVMRIQLILCSHVHFVRMYRKTSLLFRRIAILVRSLPVRCKLLLVVLTVQRALLDHRDVVIDLACVHGAEVVVDVRLLVRDAAVLDAAGHRLSLFNVSLE